MKKSLSIVLVLLFLLTACQVVPDDDQSLASTPSSSGSITPPPSSSVVPTTQPTVPPTTQPTVPPYDVCDGQLWHLGRRLFWRVKATAENIFIADDVMHSVKTDTQIFYIIKSEPAKIYVVTIGDFTDHKVYYESDYGDIVDLHYVDYRESEIRNYLQFVAEEKRFVMLDMTTGETSVILEAYLIRSAYTYDPDGEWITFEGSFTEDDPGGLYDYNRITGEIIIDDSL